jgi:hypothetical protein
VKQEDDKPKSSRISLVDTWRPPGGLTEDPYTQKTAQRRIPAEILAAARNGIYGAGLYGDARIEDGTAQGDADGEVNGDADTSGAVSAIDGEPAAVTHDEELEALDAGWDGEA